MDDLWPRGTVGDRAGILVPLGSVRFLDYDSWLWWLTLWLGWLPDSGGWCWLLTMCGGDPEGWVQLDSGPGVVLAMGVCCLGRVHCRHMFSCLQVCGVGFVWCLVFHALDRPSSAVSPAILAPTLMPDCGRPAVIVGWGSGASLLHHLMVMLGWLAGNALPAAVGWPGWSGHICHFVDGHGGVAWQTP